MGERYEVKLPDGPFGPNHNAVPSQNLPVIKEDSDGRRLEIMRWGLIPG
jgi:putative SOS response-associated peptidase YedK